MGGVSSSVVSCAYCFFHIFRFCSHAFVLTQQNNHRKQLEHQISFPLVNFSASVFVHCLLIISHAWCVSGQLKSMRLYYVLHSNKMFILLSSNILNFRLVYVLRDIRFLETDGIEGSTWGGG